MSFHPAMPYGTEQWHRSQRATLPEGPEFQYTAANRARFEQFASHYAPEHRKSAVLHALYLAQEQQGYITANAARHAPRSWAAPPPRSRTSFPLRDVPPHTGGDVRPAGVHDAVVRPAPSASSELEHTLGSARADDLTGMFTIMPMECLGACDQAP
jgi:NADH:ubiquinone oxidoreductase subunit E